MEYRSVSTNIVTNQFPKVMGKTEYRSVSTDIVPNQFPTVLGKTEYRSVSTHIVPKVSGENGIYECIN
jgi:hypothetical protein